MHASRLLTVVSSVTLTSLLATFAWAQSAPPAAPAAPVTRPAVPATGAGQTPGASAQAPAMPAPVTVTPKKFELGKVKPNSTTPAKFVLENRGSTPLKIVSAVPSCKCTAITPVAGKEIPVGGSIEISAALKAPPTPGERDAKVFVTFEGYKQPVVLLLVGDVVMDVIAEPPYLDLMKGATSGTIKLRSRDGKPFKVLSAGNAPASLVGFNQATDAPRAEYEVKWDLSKLSTLPIWWVVETDNPEARLLPLRVRSPSTGSAWDMQRFDRQWHVKDQIVFAGTLTKGKPSELTLEVEYYNPPPRPGQTARPKRADWSAFKSVQVADPSVKVEVVEVKPMSDEHFEIKIRLTASESKLIYTDCIVETATGKASVPFSARVID